MGDISVLCQFVESFLTRTTLIGIGDIDHVIDPEGEATLPREKEHIVWAAWTLLNL